MEFKKFVSLKVAVVGGGNVGDIYTAGLVLAGHEVYLATKGDSGEGINPLWERTGSVISCTIEDAAREADLIIVACHPSDVREVAYWLGDVRKKVIVDATSNIVADGFDLSNTHSAIAAITGASHIVKVFNTVGYDELLLPLFGKKKVQMVMAGDSRKAKEIIKIVAGEMGVTRIHDFGGSGTYPLFDEMTACWRRLLKPAPHIEKKLKVV